MLEFLCFFGKSVVNKAKKRRNIVIFYNIYGPGEPSFKNCTLQKPFFLQCAASGTFLIAIEALGRI